MANPNIVNVSYIYGRTVGYSLTTSAYTIVANASGSGKIYKVNSIIASNIDGTNDVDLTVRLYIDSAYRYIAYQITVPAKSTLVVLSKDTSIYLEENDNISAWASAASDVDLHISYEEIS